MQLKFLHPLIKPGNTTPRDVSNNLIGGALPADWATGMDSLRAANMTNNSIRCAALHAPRCVHAYGSCEQLRAWLTWFVSCLAVSTTCVTRIASANKQSA